MEAADFSILRVLLCLSVRSMSEHPGNVFMVVAPSGAGKSSLVRALLDHDKSLVLSVSCTTRAPRKGEADGREYRFIGIEQFEALRQNQALPAWAEVHGNFYGTPRDRTDERRLGKRCVRT